MRTKHSSHARPETRSFRNCLSSYDGPERSQTDKGALTLTATSTLGSGETIKEIKERQRQIKDFAEQRVDSEGKFQLRYRHIRYHDEMEGGRCLREEKQEKHYLEMEDDAFPDMPPLVATILARHAARRSIPGTYDEGGNRSATKGQNHAQLALFALLRQLPNCTYV
ncbi:hypothetical protein EW146_g7448 [Bondarzewia mesenterica]|uniref:Uncharacterized protein n=1 Tax=Bondarzewia mesenterica TaxID=1095465 RepID=A0A4S4LLC9_9AGAM|nr:hypothetical protein EW146_g7448 [Bondarzewia mesenterica]